jgi:plastocyanin
VSSRQRAINLAIAAVIAIVAVVVILATSGGSDEKSDETPAAATPAATSQPEASAQGKATSTPDEPAPPEIVIKDGKVVGGIAKFRVKQGDRIRFSVTADVADEVHVHAYDFMKDIEQPGDTVTFDFKADITGITEVELEDAELQIASLRVDP